MDKPGGTGKFPTGKLNNEDKGELEMEVYVAHNCVIVNFGRELSWIGLSAEQAGDMAKLLIEKASELEAVNKGVGRGNHSNN